jgi:ribosomal protein L6P/L9E
MSRIGKKPVDVPDGVTVTIDGQTVKAKGPKGELQTQLVDRSGREAGRQSGDRCQPG